MKLYDMIQNDDGSVKVQSDLTADEMRFMLELAMNTMLFYGLAPKSIAHEFRSKDDDGDKQGELDLEVIDTKDMPQH